MTEWHSACTAWRALSGCALQIPLIFAGLTFVVGAAIMASAVHIGMIIVGRLILGLGVGVGTTVRPQGLSPLNILLPGPPQCPGSYWPLHF